MALLVSVPAVSLAEQGARPNLIVIMADDIGARELSCYGHSIHRTPHLDRMGREGIRFDTCYSTPICHPTRFEIMTGQYGHHNNVYHFPGRPGGPGPAEDEIADHYTFGKHFQKAGYATAHAGKWQLTGEHPNLIRECGFDEYCMWAYKHNLPEGVEHTGSWEGKPGGKTGRYWHPSIVKNGEYVPTTADEYGPDIFADFVIDFARRHKEGKPFFIYFPMALTHGPQYSTPDTTTAEADKYRNSKDNFEGCVEYMDKIVGRISTGIDDLGLRENTVLFFTGDNGTGGNGKGQTTELGARVPMIVHGPGIVKPTGLSKHLVDLSDIFPTLAELADAPIPSDKIIDGRSYAGLLRGNEYRPRDWIYAYLGGKRVLRTRRWLLEDNSPRDFGRLYDCGESRNGTGYRDVTASKESEVVKARERIMEILADKAVPEVTAKDKEKDAVKQKRRKK